MLQSGTNLQRKPEADGARSLPIFRYPGRLTFRLNLGSHLLLHILQSGRDYVLITRSSSSKAMFLCGGHSHLEESMGNMCLASEVNNALVIFPGTEKGFCTHSRFLTTTAEPSHRHIGVCGHFWAGCGLFAVLRVGAQYNTIGSRIGPKGSGGGGAGDSMGLWLQCWSLSHRPRRLGRRKGGRLSHSSKPRRTSHPHPICCCSPISNTVLTVQVCHEARAGREAKQTAPLLRALELIFKTAKSRTQGGLLVSLP